MPFIKTIPPTQAKGDLKDVYDGLQSAFGMVPKIFESFSLRPDLLEPLVTMVQRLMFDDHELSRTDKELIAAYVSQLNACEY